MFPPPELPPLVRLMIMLSWPVRSSVKIEDLCHALIREQALRGAIVGAPADPEAFG